MKDNRADTLMDYAVRFSEDIESVRKNFLDGGIPAHTAIYAVLWRLDAYLTWRDRLSDEPRIDLKRILDVAKNYFEPKNKVINTTKLLYDQ